MTIINVHQKLSETARKSLAIAGKNAEEEQEIEIEVSSDLLALPCVKCDNTGRLYLRTGNLKRPVIMDGGWKDGYRTKKVGTEYVIRLESLIEDEAALKALLDECYNPLKLDALEVEVGRLNDDAQAADQIAKANKEREKKEIKVEAERKRIESAAARKIKEEARRAAFAPYSELDGVDLCLQYGRDDQAKDIILDFLVSRFDAKIGGLGVEIVDTAGMEYSSIAGYPERIPVEALAKLKELQQAGIIGKAYVYYEADDDDPILGLDVRLLFLDASRLVVVNVHQWD